MSPFFFVESSKIDGILYTILRVGYCIRYQKRYGDAKTPGKPLFSPGNLLLLLRQGAVSATLL